MTLRTIPESLNPKRSCRCVTLLNKGSLRPAFIFTIPERHRLWLKPLKWPLKWILRRAFIVNSYGRNIKDVNSDSVPLVLMVSRQCHWHAKEWNQWFGNGTYTNRGLVQIKCPNRSSFQHIFLSWRSRMPLIYHGLVQRLVHQNMTKRPRVYDCAWLRRERRQND